MKSLSKALLDVDFWFEITFENHTDQQFLVLKTSIESLLVDFHNSF